MALQLQFMSSRYKTKYVGVFYRDLSVPDHNGKDRAFYAVFTREGKPVEVMVGRRRRDGMTPAKAVIERSRLIESHQLAMAQSTSPHLPEPQPLPPPTPEPPPVLWTFDDIWRSYSAQLQNPRTRVVDGNRYAKHLGPVFGSRTPGELTTPEVDRLRVRLLRTHAPQTTKHVLGLLQRLINFAARCGWIDRPSPRRLLIQMPRFDNRKTETLTDAQVAALLQAAGEDENWKAGAVVKLALFTGMRKGELFNLRWSDVDLEAGFVTLPQTKSRRVQFVPLNGPARAVFEGLPRDGVYVFPGRRPDRPIHDLYPHLRRILERAGIPASIRPLHALRHTFASRLASSGTSLFVIQGLLRHASPMMTQRYAHLADEAMRRAADRAGELLGGDLMR